MARAEGSAQIGLNQRLLDFQAAQSGYATDSASASLYVDILLAGEVINLSLCGRQNTDDIEVEIFDASGTSVYTATLLDGNVDCADPMSSPLSNPLRFATLTAGTHRIVLQNESGNAFASSFFQRYDISVTPDAVTNPDPTVAAGRLWAYSWNFNNGFIINRKYRYKLGIYKQKFNKLLLHITFG